MNLEGTFGASSSNAKYIACGMLGCTVRFFLASRMEHLVDEAQPGDSNTTRFELRKPHEGNVSGSRPAVT